MPATPSAAWAHLERVERDARPGMTLLDLALLLGQPEWLKPEDVQVVHVVAGKIPVQLDPADTVLAVRLAPDAGGAARVLYVRLEGAVTVPDFLSLVHRPEAAHPLAARRVRQLAWIAGD